MTYLTRYRSLRRGSSHQRCGIVARIDDKLLLGRIFSIQGASQLPAATRSRHRLVPTCAPRCGSNSREYHHGRPARSSKGASPDSWELPSYGVPRVRPSPLADSGPSSGLGQRVGCGRAVVDGPSGGGVGRRQGDLLICSSSPSVTAYSRYRSVISSGSLKPVCM